MEKMQLLNFLNSKLKIGFSASMNLYDSTGLSLAAYRVSSLWL